MDQSRIRYHRNIVSHRLNHPRDVIVYLPQGYESRRKRYPVLYMQDGQNIIDPATSFAGVPWHVDVTADRLVHSRSIEEILIVGIYNSPDRNREYSATEQGHRYAAFVIHELKPLIDANYRTKPDREHTAVAGSSLGGLISFLFAWHYPEVFSKAACLSGSFFYRAGKMISDVETYVGAKKKIRVYLDVGSRERTLIPGYEKMVGILNDKGYLPGIDYEGSIAEGGEHNEASWGNRFWRALVFLFGKSSTRSVL
jgi:enterochelin esterase-like enzyme